jgi:predicted nucleic acid-binding protein
VAGWVVDTNLYIRALRGAEDGRELQRFNARFLPSIVIHAVVAQELLAGAVDARRARQVHENLIAPFESRGRVVTPSFEAWKMAGRIMAALVDRGCMSRGGFARSFPADCVLAASCVEERLTLVTANARDFELIREVIDVSIAAPWPA